MTNIDRDDADALEELTNEDKFKQAVRAARGLYEYWANTCEVEPEEELDRALLHDVKISGSDYVRMPLDKFERLMRVYLKHGENQT